MENGHNILLLTDSYKVSHHKQYPPGTETVYSYFESRGGEFPETVFFGLQYILEEYLAGAVVTADKIAAAERVFAQHFSGDSFFHRAGWQHIVDAHDARVPMPVHAVAPDSVLAN